METWKEVIGFKGCYEVSSQGRVKRTKAGHGARVGKVLKARDNGHGYFLVNLRQPGIRSMKYVHRIVVEAFTGPILKDKEVNHINGIKSDNRIENLEIVTPKENIQHALNVLGVDFGRKGENQSRSKLKEKDILKIRMLLEKGELLQREIAVMFSVGKGSISNISTKKTWGWLE